MNNQPRFDFIVDKDNNTLTLVREFMADRQLVWDAYTKSELLDQWFAPEPFITKTKSMNFSDGGHWLYAMIDPGGAEYWNRMDYSNIKPIDSYNALDGFCNENGEVNPDMPRATWNVTFSDYGEHALVTTVVAYNSLQDLEMVIQMGMEEGTASTLQRLDKLLLILKK